MTTGPFSRAATPDNINFGKLKTADSNKRPAVVLLSGGLDSATAAAVCREQGFALHALSVEYGQRHAVELRSARRVAAALAVCHHVVTTVDLRVFGGSALTDEIDVPKHPTGGSAQAVPVTYVPARNTIFLSLALAYAETIGATDIFIGANIVDYAGYPDCRPEFLRAFEQLAELGTKMGTMGKVVHVHAPLISMTKAEIIREGLRLGVDFALTHSCYDPPSDETACGLCDSCRWRLRGFQEAGVPDPIRYATRPGT